LNTVSWSKASIWLALLVAPTLALLNLSVVYALVVPACEEQNTLPLHVFSVMSLLLCLLFTLMAWRQWRQHPASADAPEDDAAVRKNFLSAIAALAGLLSSVVIIAQWIPQWVLSPCLA
jgi:heme/copper-type cytochrome/quinol oxidase subunit 3